MLTVPAELRGKERRQAAGAALYEVMSDLVFRTTSTDRTIFRAVVEARQAERHGPCRDRGPGERQAHLSPPARRRQRARTEALGARPGGRAVGVMLPNANGAAVTILGLISAGRVPAMINFTAGLGNILSACTAAEVKTIVTSRAFVEKANLVDPGGGARGEGRDRLPRGYPRRRRPSSTGSAVSSSRPARSLHAQPRRSRRDPLHLRLGGRAEGRRPLPPQHPRQRRPGRRADRLRPHRQGLQRAAALPLLRLHGRSRPAARLRRRHLSLSLAAPLPARTGARLRLQRHHPLRYRHLPCGLCADRAMPTISARSATCSPVPSR